MGQNFRLDCGWMERVQKNKLSVVQESCHTLFSFLSYFVLGIFRSNLVAGSLQAPLFRG